MAGTGIGTFNAPPRRQRPPLHAPARTHFRVRSIRRLLKCARLCGGGRAATRPILCLCDNRPFWPTRALAVGICRPTAGGRGQAPRAGSGRARVGGGTPRTSPHADLHTLMGETAADASRARPTRCNLKKRARPGCVPDASSVVSPFAWEEGRWAGGGTVAPVGRARSPITAAATRRRWGPFAQAHIRWRGVGHPRMGCR
eukprot:gene8839-biopygen3163